MSQRSSNNTHTGIWTPQGQGESGAEYTQGVTGYCSRAEQGPSQPGAEMSYYQHHYRGNGTPQYPRLEPGAGEALYLHNTAGSGGAYPVQTATHGFSSTCHSSPYTNIMSQYNQQQTQSSPVTSGSQGMFQPYLAASPIEYTSPHLSPVGPRMTTCVDTSYSSYNSWPRSLSSAPGSSSGRQPSVGQSAGSGAEYVVPCPYNCGTVLTGVHAVGNMTRHLKSQNCIGSGKDKPRYECPVEGCEKRYIRSDGLKVHLRKRHNITQLSDRNGGFEYDESRYGYS